MPTQPERTFNSLPELVMSAVSRRPYTEGAQVLRAANESRQATGVLRYSRIFICPMKAKVVASCPLCILSIRDIR